MSQSGDGSPVDFGPETVPLIAQMPVNTDQPQNRPPVGHPVILNARLPSAALLSCIPPRSGDQDSYLLSY